VATRLLSLRAARAMLARDAGAGVDIKSAETLVLGPECRRFSYAELDTATNGYPDANVIGEGGFGKARGVFPAGSCSCVDGAGSRGRAPSMANCRVPEGGAPARGSLGLRLSDSQCAILLRALTGPRQQIADTKASPLVCRGSFDMCRAPCAGVPGHPGERQVHRSEEARPARHAGLHVGPLLPMLMSTTPGCCCTGLRFWDSAPECSACCWFPGSCVWAHRRLIHTRQMLRRQASAMSRSVTRAFWRPAGRSGVQHRGEPAERAAAPQHRAPAGHLHGGGPPAGGLRARHPGAGLMSTCMLMPPAL